MSDPPPTENQADKKTTSSEKQQLRLEIQRGPSKRSLSLFSNIKSIDPKKKFRAEFPMLDDLSGDEMEDQDQEMDELPPSPSQPPANFSVASVYASSVSRAPQGVKKIAIKNFRKKNVTADEVEWTYLEEAVTAINKHQPVKHSLEQLYTMVTNVCTVEKAGEMYTKLLLLSRTHLTLDRDELTANRDIPAIEFLKLLNDLWNNFCEQTLMIRNIFLYLDRTYILSRPEVMSIWDAALSIFSEVVIDNTYVRERLVRDVLTLINNERKGEKVDRPLIRSLLRMLSNLHIYEQVFEKPFITATAELYKIEGATLSRELEISSYLQHVCRRLEEEEDRVNVYLDNCTKKQLMETAQNTLISEHLEPVMSRGLESLLEQDKVEDLHRLYMLVVRVNTDAALILLKNHFTEYVKKHGRSIVMDTARDKEMVGDLMTFKDKCDRIVSECFEKQEKLQQSLKDSFDYFINTRPNKPAELIAKFVDLKLRSGNKEASDEELDHIMDKVITLFRFIHGKDVFEAFYKKDLAKRLLLSRSASVDAEKAMLSKLKQECGAGFTQKLEGMFKDMEVSKDLGIAFKQFIDHEVNVDVALKTEFSIFVLTMGQWPNYEYAEVTLPRELAVCFQSFRVSSLSFLTIYKKDSFGYPHADFYVSRHNGRKLEFQHSLGHCLLKGTFRPGCVKELQVSLFQTIVLLLFNEKPKWKYEEITEATKIEQKELERTLQSLACAKIRILSKTPKGRDVQKGDEFEVNESLNEKLYRIKVSQVQMKETPEEHKATEESVNTDRQYQIDAAIVRIMKTRKDLVHQQLIQELFGQLKFPVNSADLKTRIASLMDRDFISRDASDPNLYHYVS